MYEKAEVGELGQLYSSPIANTQSEPSNNPTRETKLAINEENSIGNDHAIKSTPLLSDNPATGLHDESVRRIVEMQDQQSHSLENLPTMSS